MSPTRRSAIWLVAALLATPAAAEVISPRAEAVAVTVYRDDAIPDPAAEDWNGYGLAMISETRTVDLPVGESRLVFDGVADGLIPQTASIGGLPGQVAEQNFDFDLLGPGSLVAHSIGAAVHVVRTDRKTGRESRADAVIRSGPDGVVLDFGAGHIEALQCSGGAERLVFDDVPAGLTGRATLSTRVRVTTPGRYKVRLTYLTVGLAWRAGYVARLAAAGDTLDLTGWITLANHGETGFADAPTGVVAGRLARQAIDLVRPYVARRQSACWPTGTSHHPRGDRPLSERERRILGRGMYGILGQEDMYNQAVPVSVSAYASTKRASESNLGDYKLYTLDEPTTVTAHQTKQVLFLSQPGVRFDRVYVHRLVMEFGCPCLGGVGGGPAVTTLRFENKTAKGLGRALPAGSVSVRRPGAAGGQPDLFVGQPDLRDVSVNEPFELEIGQASDVQVRWRVTTAALFLRHGRYGRRTALEVTLTNAKTETIAAEIRHPIAGHAGFKVVSQSAPHTTKGGDPVWRVPLAAGETATLTYTIEQVD